MKMLAIFGIGIAIGLAVGLYLSRGALRLYYETTRPIQLRGSEAQVVGVLPAGTPLVTDATLRDSPDLGWWGYVPIYFSTMAEAVELGVEARESPVESEIMEATLRAHLPVDVPRAGEAPPPEEVEPPE